MGPGLTSTALVVAVILLVVAVILLEEAVDRH